MDFTSILPALSDARLANLSFGDRPRPVLGLVAAVGSAAAITYAMLLVPDIMVCQRKPSLRVSPIQSLNCRNGGRNPREKQVLMSQRRQLSSAKSRDDAVSLLECYLQQLADSSALEDRFYYLKGLRHFPALTSFLVSRRVELQ